MIIIKLVFIAEVAGAPFWNLAHVLGAVLLKYLHAHRIKGDLGIRGVISSSDEASAFVGVDGK